MKLTNLCEFVKFKNSFIFLDNLSGLFEANFCLGSESYLIPILSRLFGNSFKISFYLSRLKKLSKTI